MAITALADETIPTTLTSEPDLNRRVEIFGIGSGYNLKARQSNTFTLGETLTESEATIVRISTKNASWTQTSQWRLTLNISSGEFTGKFTVYLPIFKLDIYSDLYLWITNDGASYFGGSCECSFDNFAAGHSDATEDLTSDISAGSNVVCVVADTTGFYLGDKVYLKDTDNDEWCRIKAISTNTSITVDSLAFNYTSASINKDIVIKTPGYRRKSRRSLINYPSMVSDSNVGVTTQMGLPHSKDDDENIKVLIQYMGSSDNATNKKIKIRLQYLPLPIGDVCEPSNEKGTVLNGFLTPPTTAYTHYYESIFSISASDFGTAHAVAFQIVRLGADAEDEYAGDLIIIAVLILTKNNRIGMAI
jgi:hypothetical protein